jgi:hypothetical protein
VRTISVILFLLVLAQAASAQQETQMSLPSSPAFSILNFEPSTVMKPTSNKDLGADILNSFDENGKLLLNLGLEVSPYWLKSRPTLTRAQYLNPTVSQCFWQSLNLSAATVKDSVTEKNKFGVGLRFKLVNGKPTNDYLEIEKQLNTQLNISNVILGGIANVGETIQTREAAIEFITSTLTELKYSKDVIEGVKNAAEEKATAFDDSKEGIRSFLMDLNSSIIDSNGGLIKKVAELSKKRVGLIIEFAGASGFITSEKKSFDRAGIWINASNYFTPNDAWTLTARYLFANKDSGINNFDMGLSYLKELNKINIAVEGAMRWYRANIPDLNSNNQPITRTEKDFTYRFSVQGSYKIATDISFNISVGKDFNSPFVNSTGFFSIFGINYSLFKSPKVDLSKTPVPVN